MDEQSPRMTKQDIFQRFRRDAGLIKCVQMSRNFGLLGGWLRTEFYVFSNGDPTGFSTSKVQYEFSIDL